MYTPIIQNRTMGCHGNGAISHSPNTFLLGDIFSHLVGTNEQFGTHEKLSCELGGGAR